MVSQPPDNLPVEPLQLGPKSSAPDLFSFRSRDITYLHRRFLLECQDGTIKKRSPATIKNYQHAFSLLVSWFRVSTASDLTEALLRQFFRRGEAERSWKPGTTLTHRKSLAPFFAWCVERGFIHVDPLLRIPAPVSTDRLPTFYSEDELERLLYFVDVDAHTTFERARNKAIVGVMLLAGLRKGEVLGLRISDIDLVEDVLRVRAETAKNRRTRAVRINSKLHALLEDYMLERERTRPEILAFWISATTKSVFTANGLKHLFDKLSKRAGFRVAAHKMRHTFATRFYQGSKDIVSLGQILGHRRITTTLIYTHVLPESTSVALEQNPLNSMF